MKNISIIITTFVIGILYGCSDYNRPEHNYDKFKELGLIVPDGSFYQTKRADTVIAYDLGKYLEYLAPSDYVVGLSSSRLNPLDNECIYAYSGMTRQSHMTRSAESTEYMSASINGIHINSDKKDVTNAQDNKNLRSCFGKNNTFHIHSSENPLSKSTSELTKEDTTEIYVPEIIEITSPQITSETTLYPLCDYKNFVLRWNADLNNENGVIIIVEWTGTMLLGDDSPDVYVRYVDLVCDTGETVIKPEMFDEIPDTALCHLTLLRGNVGHVISEGYSCKILGESHQCLSFILLKNLKHL